MKKHNNDFLFYAGREKGADKQAYFELIEYVDKVYSSAIIAIVVEEAKFSFSPPTRQSHFILVKNYLH